MNETTETTTTAIAARYLAVWSEPDPDARRAAIAGLWAPDAGRRYFAADSFFLLRVPDPAVSTDGQEELERSIITGHRWWTVDELRHAADEVSPCGLGDLIAGVLADGVPERPVCLPWR